MSNQKRQKSKRYSGVYYRNDASGKERPYYIRYRTGGLGAKQVDEPVGKSTAGMIEAKANQIRIDRMRGKELFNVERRRAAEAEKRQSQGWPALQKLLTHLSPPMTERYVHLADKAMKRAASVADSIFMTK